ncbi:hypothetical protein IHQ68_04665 [Chelatococcus sambhunathii]|uniref:CopL family metal-binding regulatory protein n=1 Tax=Chelatococcus sambhunathii TaxID=363953 RepID=A0ABU1DCV0_9HYPH|nr:hypothetical protein [Chelatococcus sambhunathii]MDR4305919.1 hypothetical protein [Chelatococcus sambhunathii]
MTLRSLIRMVAGLALAVFVASIWATPGEAHEGHRAPAAQTEQAIHAPAAAPADVGAQGQVAETASADCAGHMSQSGSGKSTCCSNTCHAVISADMEPLQAVTLEVTALPAAPAPVAVSGPAVHIKRPPRPSAAQVG